MMARNKWLNRPIVVVLMTFGSALLVGIPVLVFFLIVRLLSFFWAP
jgi:hypothetical protein